MGRDNVVGPEGRENGKDIGGSSKGPGVKPTNKTGDGGHDGPKGRGPTGDIEGTNTAKAPDDAFSYLNVSSSDFDYLEHFKKESYLEAGHNTTLGPVDRARAALAAGTGDRAAVQTAVANRTANRAPVIAARSALQDANQRVKQEYARGGGEALTGAQSAMTAAKSTFDAAKTQRNLGRTYNRALNK